MIELNPDSFYIPSAPDAPKVKEKPYRPGGFFFDDDDEDDDEENDAENFIADEEDDNPFISAPSFRAIQVISKLYEFMTMLNIAQDDEDDIEAMLRAEEAKLALEAVKLERDDDLQRQRDYDAERKAKKLDKKRQQAKLERKKENEHKEGKLKIKKETEVDDAKIQKKLAKKRKLEEEAEELRKKHAKKRKV